MKLLLSYITLILVSIPLFSQVGKGGMPYSLRTENILLKSHEIKTVSLPEVSNEKEILKTDSINNHQYIKKAYYGKAMEVSIDILQDAQSIKVKDGTLWIMKINSEDAFGLQFFFDQFWIPEGGELFFYDQSRTQILGSFGAHNNNKRNQFATQYIIGDEVYLEYFEPYRIRQSARLHVDYMVHAFKSISASQAKYGNSGNCNVNIACESDPAFKDLSKSVALILSMDNNNMYSNWCTGTLLNNTANDGTPYFISASHCGDVKRVTEGWDAERFNVSNWIFIFNYEFNGCQTIFNDTVPTNSVFGSELLAVDPNDGKTNGSPNYHSDYLFLKLNTDSATLANYGVFYAGWESKNDVVAQTNGTTSIHHPSGDAKKISRSAGIPVSSKLYAVGEDDTQWRVEWSLGVTEPGSSGCPLFNDQYRFIGQLVGGGASCFNTSLPDYFGKFSTSWIDGQLAQWLDPNNTGQTNLEAFPGLDTSLTVTKLGTGLFVIPNYVNDQINFRLTPQLSGAFNIKIFNTVGALMQQKENVFQSQSIDVSRLETGMYILSVKSSSDVTFSTKFFKE